MIKSSNPALGKETFSSITNTDGGETMTLEGTINKTGLFLLIVVLGAVISWSLGTIFLGFIIPLIIINLLIGIVIIWKKYLAGTLGFLYSFLEGLLLGVLSLFFDQQIPGIVIQAVTGTLGVFGVMLFLYKNKIIQVTENFKLGVVAATGGIIIIYLISLVGVITGLYSVPYIHEAGLIGIGFSVFIVGVAALNFVMDFDFIEKGVEEKVPKYMEYYGAFGLIVTLIWLYFEILKLLSKLKSD